MTKRQADIFHDSEAERWFARNQGKIPVKDDPVMEAIETAKIKPKVVLEVGCSNGWRVKLMQKQWGCEAYGIDPLFKTQVWNCRSGTADDLTIFEDEKFNVVIYGWCLYLCDREDLFYIAAEGDRVLQEGGFIVVHDFVTAKAYKRKYKHHEDVFSFKMDYSHLWLANPSYRLIYRVIFGTGEDKTAVTVLKKSVEEGWPLHD